MEGSHGAILSIGVMGVMILQESGFETPDKANRTHGDSGPALSGKGAVSHEVEMGKGGEGRRISQGKDIVDGEI